MKNSLFLVALPFSLAFNSITIADEELFEDELPVVISATRLNQSVLTSPTSVTVIDKAMIEASGFTEFVDLMRLVPGFQVAHIDGRRFSAVYHGYGSEISNRLQVLVNGRSTYTPTLSTVDWDMLGVNIQDIERIEVVRGSSASAFGSNSFTAAINIITKAPELDDSLYIQVRSGNDDDREQLIRHSDIVGNMHYRVTASHREAEGYDDIEDSRDFNHFSFHGRVAPESNNPIDIHLAYTDGETGTDANERDLEARDREVTSWSAHIQGKHILSSNKDIKWNFYHNSDEVDDVTNTLPWSELVGITPAQFEFITGTPDQTTLEGVETNDASKTDFEVQYISTTKNNLRYVIGTGIRYDTLESFSYFREKGEQSDITYRLFANGQLPINKHLTANAGAIYENTEGYTQKTSYRGSLNWEILNSQSIRLSVSRGYRFPSLLERNFDTRTTLDNGLVIDERFLSDENLQPEEINSYDLAYLGKLSSLPISWDIKLYKDKITDFVSFPEDTGSNDPVGNFSRFITNGGDYTAYGIEGDITYRPRNHYFIRFLFNRGHSEANDLAFLNPTEEDSSSNRIPRKSHAVIGAIDIDDWKFNLGVYYTGKMEWFSTGDLVESYTRVDASISKSFKLDKNSKLKLTVGAQNLGDRDAQFNDDVFFERRYYATLSLSKL
jgi:iron complex outermembrane receptor protein